MIPQEFFGIGASELVLLLVLGVIMFGPEKLPQLSRKAARVVHFVRVFANQAMGSLRDELGPEYKDLQLSDLNPKTLVRKTLLADIEDDIVEIKRDLDGVRNDLTGAASDINGEVRSAKPVISAAPVTAKDGAPEESTPGTGTAQAQASSSPNARDKHIPWDDEAT